MTSVNREIANLLDKHISIQKCLKRNIVNVRSLARFLIEIYNLNYSVDAVISAIRRYDLDKVSNIVSQESNELFSKMTISTKDNVARLVLKDGAFDTVCKDYLDDKLLKQNSRVIKSKETVTVLVSQKNLKEKQDLFKKDEIVSITKDLAEMRLQFHKDITVQKGIIARVAMELATRDINIQEVIFSFPDLLLYVKESDVVDAHQVLREIKK